MSTTAMGLEETAELPTVFGSSIGQRPPGQLPARRAATLQGAGQGDATTLNLLRRNIREIPRGLLGMSPLDPTNPTEMYRIMSTPTPLVAGIFVGRRAATWNAQAAARARELEAQGVDARTIWNETGTWRGKDGKLRQEISDQPAAIQERVVSDIQQQGMFQGPLSEAMRHEELFRAYPGLAEVPTTMYAAPIRRGSFSGQDIEVAGPSTAQQRRTALHETQHAIQQLEGFARGGSSTMAFANPEAFKILQRKLKELTTPQSLQEYSRLAWGMETPNEEVKAAYKQYAQQVKRITPEVDRMAQESAAKEYYRRLAGETEARAVEARRNLTPEQRRAMFPEESFDIPQSELIMRQGSPGEMMGVSALDVFHGSPHRFTKLDSSKIGTGEGAQRYGYGLYFAENPNVAKGYRNVLADTLEINGYATDLEKRAGQMALTFGDNTKEGAIRWLSKFEGKGASHTTPALTPELINSVKAKFESGIFNKGGSLYTIDLPDRMIDRMLDWDKPLSQQSRAVRKAIKADRPGLFMEGRYSDILTAGSTLAARGITGPDAVAGHNPAYRYGVSADAMTGQDYWHLIMRDRQLNPADASEAMRQAGIPGIKYLDQGSRGAGAGTRNFVVFPGEEEALTILSRD